MASNRGTVWFSGYVSSDTAAESEVVPEKRLQRSLKAGTLQSMEILKVGQVNYGVIIGKPCMPYQALMAQNLRHSSATLCK